jgi:hypothetical protein
MAMACTVNGVYALRSQAVYVVDNLCNKPNEINHLKAGTLAAHLGA